jgi:3-hydroxybutyrate dehydrogenase
VEEVGGSGIAVFLTSEAATSITGTTISADGGLTAR